MSELEIVRQRVADALHLWLDDCPKDSEWEQERWVARVQEWADWLGQQLQGAVAAEVRRLADELNQARGQMRQEDDRTVRSSGMGEAVRRLRERADELEPTGRGSVSIR